MALDGKRRHSRVRDDIPVRWYIDNNALRGQGILRNLSVSGAMLETKTLIAPGTCSEIELHAVESVEKDIVPRSAKLIWGKGAREGRGYYFYGLEFKTISDTNRAALADRVENKIKSISFGLGSGMS